MTGSGFNNSLSAPLTKRGFVLRHGRSEANEAGIVASKLLNAETAYGLTESGRGEVTASVQAKAALMQEDPPLRILASPFLRTRQSAEIASQLFGVPLETDRRLGERSFGDFELLSDAHYEEVWAADPITPNVIPGQAETVYEVVERVIDVIMEVERNPDINTCLLVTHRDVAMILSCAVLFKASTRVTTVLSIQ